MPNRVEISDDWREHVDEAVHQLFAEKLGPDIAADAARHAPVGPSWGFDAAHPRVPAHQGGELKESVTWRIEDGKLIIEAAAPYAAWVELGTGPHPIDSLGPWSMWSPVTDQYFGRHVNHPGTHPEPFLRPALFKERGDR